MVPIKSARGRARGMRGGSWGAGLPISRADSRNTVPTDVSFDHFRVGEGAYPLNLYSGGAHQLRRLTRRFKCIGFENSPPASEPWLGSW